MSLPLSFFSQRTWLHRLNLVSDFPTPALADLISLAHDLKNERHSDMIIAYQYIQMECRVIKNIPPGHYFGVSKHTRSMTPEYFWEFSFFIYMYIIHHFSLHAYHSKSCPKNKNAKFLIYVTIKFFMLTDIEMFYLIVTLSRMYEKAFLDVILY